MFCAALRTLSAVTIVNSFRKAKLHPNANIVNNWQYLCQNLDDEVTLDDFTAVNTMPLLFNGSQRKKVNQKS